MLNNIKTFLQPNRKFIGNSFIALIGTGLIGFFNFAFHFYTARQFSLSEYGELQSLLALLTIFLVFATTINYVVIKESSSKTFAAQLLRKKTYLWSFGLAFALAISSPLIATYLQLQSPVGVLWVAVAVLFSTVTGFYSGLLQSARRFSSFYGVQIVSVVLKLVGAALVVWLALDKSWTLAGVAVAGGAGYLFAVIFSRLSRRDESQVISSLELPNTQQVILPIFLFAALLALLSNIDVVMFKHIATSELAGAYSALKVIASTVLVINTAIISVVIPYAVSSSQEQGRVHYSLVTMAYGLIGLISLLFVAGFAVFAEPIIALLLGEKYVLISGWLWLFGLMSAALSLLMLEANLAYARHRFVVNYILAGVAITVLVGAYFIETTIPAFASLVLLASFTGFVCLCFDSYVISKK